MKFLIIDDTRYNLAVLQKMVQHAGHEAYISDSITKAFELLKRHEFDVVIADQVMPEMSGLDFYKNCDVSLGLNTNKKLPVFFMLTSYLDEELKKKAYRIGFSAVMSKPLKETHLLDLIDRTQAGEFEKKVNPLHVLCVGTEEHFKDMLISTIPHQHLEVSTCQTLQEGVAYYKSNASITHIFCIDMFPDGLTVIDFTKQALTHTHFNDQGMVSKPAVTMVLSSEQSESQKYLVETALRQDIRDIITLPVSAARLRQALGDNTQETDEDPRPAILIIDDIVFNCSYLEKLLKPYGRCLKATSGRQALSLFHSNPGICLVVCDLQMPDIHGLDIYRHIQQTKHINGQGETVKIPFIFVTASTQAEIVEQAQTVAEEQKGNVHFFQKPMSADDFVDVSKKALNLNETEDPIAKLFAKKAKTAS